jgi:ABC-type polysaccharide/polyol phosphate export permease
MTNMREGQTAELANQIAGRRSSESATSAAPCPTPRIVTTRPRSQGLGERWGNLTFVVSSLVMRDFRVRYRNMSVGVLWSLANPLIMMLVLTFVFIRVFPNNSIKSYPIFFLTGLVPFNFFTLAWSAGTVSLHANATLVKRVRVQKEFIPISAVLAQSLHFVIQMGLLLTFVLVVGLPITRLWLWILPIMLVELVSVSGMALLCSAFDVYLRDTRYVVDSTVTVLFWLTPIVYQLNLIPDHYRLIYELNPIASAVICLRNVLLDIKPPAAFGTSLVVAIVILGIGLGLFASLKGQFGDHL